jgi:hypothetical protein
VASAELEARLARHDVDSSDDTMEGVAEAEADEREDVASEPQEAVSDRGRDEDDGASELAELAVSPFRTATGLGGGFISVGIVRKQLRSCALQVCTGTSQRSTGTATNGSSVSAHTTISA